MKKAILAVSFGVSRADVIERCIRPIEAALEAAFPDHEVRRAFTSREIVERLRRQGSEIENETEALGRLHAEGYETTVVPITILHGGEYERICNAAGSLPVSEALLETKADLDRMAGLLARIAEEEKQPLLLMGHGAEHDADDTYARLQERLPENVLIACIAGNRRLEDILAQLEHLPGKQLTLMPLMLTAGIHAREFLHGKWKTLLESRGFEIRIRMQGLGELPEIGQCFVQKVQRIL